MLLACVCPAVVLTALGLGIALGASLSAGGASPFTLGLLGRALATLPAVWVMVSLAVALVGVWPQAADGDTLQRPHTRQPHWCACPRG